MKPIYEPRGKAKEYCDLAVNIYTGCNHGCVYCYAPRVLHKTKEQFAVVEPRNGIVDALKKQLSTGEYINREIQLCFTCDPYPANIDTTPTREVIQAIKRSGNRVRILTKGGNRALRDLDLLDENDWFGVTLTGACENEPNAAPDTERYETIREAFSRGIKTWVSLEPVYYDWVVYSYIKKANAVNTFKIGKPNYAPSEIDWGEFGRQCERLCKEYQRNYYIKEDLRALM